MMRLRLCLSVRWCLQQQGITSVNGQTGDVEGYQVDVISADATAEAYHVYVLPLHLH